MFECEKCWEKTCECGWDYRHLSYEKRIEIAAAVLGVKRLQIRLLLIPKQHPMIADETCCAK